MHKQQANEEIYLSGILNYDLFLHGRLKGITSKKLNLPSLEWLFNQHHKHILGKVDSNIGAQW